MRSFAQVGIPVGQRVLAQDHHAFAQLLQSIQQCKTAAQCVPVGRFVAEDGNVLHPLQQANRCRSINHL